MIIDTCTKCGQKVDASSAVSGDSIVCDSCGHGWAYDPSKAVEDKTLADCIWDSFLHWHQGGFLKRKIPLGVRAGVPVEVESDFPMLGYWLVFGFLPWTAIIGGLWWIRSKHGWIVLACTWSQFVIAVGFGLTFKAFMPKAAVAALLVSFGFSFAAAFCGWKIMMGLEEFAYLRDAKKTEAIRL